MVRAYRFRVQLPVSAFEFRLRPQGLGCLGFMLRAWIGGVARRLRILGLGIRFRILSLRRSAFRALGSHSHPTLLCFEG